MGQAKLVILAAGGTGGHLFPAEALSHALRAKGIRVVLMTDPRGAEFAGDFPADAVIPVPSATPSGLPLSGKIRVALEVAKGVLAARRIVRDLKPGLVVGFGGYPTVPPVLGAALGGVKTMVHEQNAVIGRANRFLSGWVDAIATGFAEVGGLPAKAREKCRHVGNPVRPAVVAAVSPYPWPGEGPFNLLVFGGSQGARVMADILPPAIQLLAPEERARLVITQQARAEDDSRVSGIYESLGVKAEIAPFFKDLPARMAKAHLVIGRSGASTVAELTVIGRPAILVPLPGSLDQDQAANAAFLEKRGAAIRVLQPDFTPRRLAGELSKLLQQPSHLTVMAESAKSAGIADAADRLAAVVTDVAGF
ncbi:MAG TPA: undecaprenyldiphospho-muramoylpentapeptide beta-N-acetylglucosaminyltransferase [Bosea sp. (in: a-proteobacteria)]|jgi:UDP-N-acetylglucosamine--N-acetylmuramyl-(pentapeptide) pyrophosphoryl-undecaprenol N-acetylglucosamine transferase|uniref:undecaprenyldiphospho-muramoylpentapeptide beta-N-acetylglucosaminyltransferase n=1 Tax=Bosea sp. (in: a-proteobacteria) TaxID=1871050 RepID=UPI002DDD912E|nr:undecaprenyldiphospho-muramoylpentapeptide beta-N-acetylglucosaminyltransferase [Bosea sp. (in: a-proteobacteria)]HEV2554826.1 undecaprenyldiphospho-muramoylpentapeptide beta-N-acetylglucosaminyltransferase [Bosea sp. (in: a-proteobacteria)]